MATLDKDGNYPLVERSYRSSDDYVMIQTQEFDRLWREYFSTLPPLDQMPINLREKLKDFVQKVYFNALMDIDKLQKLVNQAYEDGYETGKNNGEEDMLEKVRGEIASALERLE